METFDSPSLASIVLASLAGAAIVGIPAALRRWRLERRMRRLGARLVELGLHADDRHSRVFSGRRDGLAVEMLQRTRIVFGALFATGWTAIAYCESPRASCRVVPAGRAGRGESPRAPAERLAIAGDARSEVSPATWPPGLCEDLLAAMTPRRRGARYFRRSGEFSCDGTRVIARMPAVDDEESVVRLLDTAVEFARALPPATTGSPT